jgi:hypothetical protein
MNYMPVNLFIIAPSGAPIEGALVKVFDEAGTLAFTEGTTDDRGVFACLLPVQTYQVRCFKRQVAFGRPRLIAVLDPPTTNDFTLTGALFYPPTSNDLRLCLASGFFRGPNGDPAVNVTVHFIAKFDPILLDGEAVLSPERVHVRTNKDGFMRVTLIRNGEYDVMIQGFEDMLRTITVPDRSSVNLPDLLFPVVASIHFDPPGPYTVALDQEIAVTPTILTTSNEVLPGTAIADVNWRSSDTNILSVKAGNTTLTLRGIGVGYASILAERADTSIIRIPDVPLAGVPVPVTVA